MKTSLASRFACAALAAALSACAATPRGPAGDAAAQLERLKQLEGAWVTANGSEGAPPGSQIHYRVTGAGSTVLETIMPGTEHEMISVYHAAGGRLAMTHYCSAGNQPYMLAKPSGDATRLEFECVGGANVDRKRGLYMSRAEFEFVSESRVNATWTATMDGKPHHTVRFELVRSWM
jgi:hypothetical protein